MTPLKISAVLVLVYSSIAASFASPIGETTVAPDEDATTVTAFEIIFRVEESENTTDSFGDELKVTVLPANEVKNPVKDAIIVFRQEEEEEEDESEEEEEGPSEPAPAESSSTTAPEKVPSGALSPEDILLSPPEDIQPSRPAPAVFEKSPRPPKTTEPPIDQPSNSADTEEGNLGPFEGLQPALPGNVSDLDESEVSEEPSPPQKPSIQPVQDGSFPVQEPGEFIRRPVPTEPPPPPAPRPEPFDPEVTHGIPVEENPGVVAKENQGNAPAPAATQVPEIPPQEAIAVLPPATGKYKITKPKIPAAVVPAAKPPAAVDHPLSIGDEWNHTNSIFTLSPQGRAACECGKTPFKVDNADASGINEYPWTVAVVRSGIFGGSRPHCGGVLINNAYILSSASCFESLIADNVQIWLTAHNNLQGIDNTIHSDRILKRDAREILMHPNYDRRTHDNDIALVRLSRPVDISTSSYYVPACLPAGMGTYDGMSARVLSWTSTMGSNRFVSTRMCKEDIRVISNQVCNRDSAHRNKVTGNQMCAGSLAKQPADSCVSDAGGPLLLPNNGRFTLIGLVSHGFNNRQAYTPVVYTRVGTYADWILHNTEDAEWCSL